jgi:hypothetical protein
METNIPKASLILLRVMFWTFWLGTVGLPLIAFLGVGRRLAQFMDYDPLFCVLAYVSLTMMCLTSASCVKSLPRLARFGMATAGIILLVILFVVLAMPAWVVGSPS